MNKMAFEAPFSMYWDDFYPYRFEKNDFVKPTISKLREFAMSVEMNVLTLEFKESKSMYYCFSIEDLELKEIFDFERFRIESSSYFSNEQEKEKFIEMMFSSFGVMKHVKTGHGKDLDTFYHSFESLIPDFKYNCYVGESIQESDFMRIAEPTEYRIHLYCLFLPEFGDCYFFKLFSVNTNFDFEDVKILLEEKEKEHKDTFDSFFEQLEKNRLRLII